MSMLKRGVESFFFFILIILNILDFIEYKVFSFINLGYVAPDIDFSKKIISWALMTYLLYHLGFTEILVGYKNKLVDTALLASYTLFIVKDLFYYLLNTKLGYFKGVADTLLNYSSQISFVSFNVSAFIMLLLSLYIAFYVHIEKNSMLGSFGIHDRKHVIKFIVALLSINFVAYFIFNIAFQWFTIVIDAPLVMIALVYYFIAAKKFHQEGSKLHGIASFGEKILQKFISFFHSKYTIPIGLISLLALHFLTDLFVFIVPTFIKIKDSLYFSVLTDISNVTIFELFVQNARGMDLYSIINLSVAYIANLGFITTLFIAPFLIIKGIYNKDSVDFHPLDKMIVIPSFLLYYLFPIYKISSFNSVSSRISGVSITIEPVKQTLLFNLALPLLLVIIFALLVIHRFKKSDMTSVSLILVFIPINDYVTKYFSSTNYYYVDQIRKNMYPSFALIIFTLFIYLLLFVLFYWTSISLFIYETFKINFFDKLAAKVNIKNVDDYSRFMQNTHNLAIFLVFGIMVYLLSFFISTVFVIFRLHIHDFLIPIIITIIFVVLPKAYAFFEPVDFGFKIKNLLLSPIALLIGIMSGAAFVYFREPLVYTSNYAAMIIIYLVFVAMNEEILFRHYLQHYASKVTSFRNAMIFQSLMFALIHLPKGVNFSAFIAIFMFGILMTLIKEKAGLANAMISHFAANVILYYWFLW